MATSNAPGGCKLFSGVGANERDLKLWKTWCLSRMILMTTLTEKSRGPFVYSMLDGDALTAVEHMEIAEFAIEGGENLIFNILEARYPDKDPLDRAGTAVLDVFEVSARERERLIEWSARAASVFHAFQRDAGITFPDMVKRYLCLHRCGQSSGAGSHWRQVRNCIACTSSEVVLSGVPSPTAQSKVSRSVRVGNADRRGRRGGDR